MLTVTFDVDATLLRIAPAARADAHQRAMHAIGTSVAISVNARRGAVWNVGAIRPLPNTVWEIAQFLTGSNHPDRWVERYSAALDRAWGEVIAEGAAVEAAAGVVDLLDGLEADGFSLGVVSGEPEVSARALLDAAGLAADRFTVGAFGDQGRRDALVALASAAVERPGRVFAHVSSNGGDMRSAHLVGVMAVGVADDLQVRDRFAQLRYPPARTVAELGPELRAVLRGARRRLERAAVHEIERAH